MPLMEAKSMCEGQKAATVRGKDGGVREAKRN